MKEVSQKNFGLLIAYVVPGLVALWGASYFSDTVKLWLTSTDGAQPTVAGFLYVTLGSLAAGLTLGAVRTVTIDALHHLTGVGAPELDFSDFQAKFWAFNQLVESDYRYYQFYAHMSLAVPGFVAARIVAKGEWSDWRYLAASFLLEMVLLAVSRGSLKTYYARISHLLGRDASVSTSPDKRKTRTKEPKVTAHSAASEESSGQLSEVPKPGRVARW
ncbi:MAG: hypothetical protein K2Y37_27095 [Pirellulales bacterium]|nr:hypothetical protein [Pirellulales bacterium]